jgi:ATP-dependent protease ClpP protease subunit
MSRIEIRGVIVPSNYDVEWMSPYIEKGIISPESYIRNAIANAQASEPLNVYINSPGGSVFAAYEIINSLVGWRAETKQPVNITVGAMAASAASAIAILSGAKVSAHRNTKLMFHGAWTVSIGGKELHEDTADLLEKINADIKAQLVSKHGIDAERVDEWFAEGRAGWLSASEAFEFGLVSEIVDQDDAEIDFAESDIAQIEENGMAIAALLEPVSGEGDGESDESEGDDDDGGNDNSDEDKGDDGNGEDEGDGSGDEDNGEGEGDEDPDAEEQARFAAAVAERVELLIGERTQEIAEQLATAKAAIERRDGTIKELQSKHDKALSAHAKVVDDFEKRIATMQSALEQANARASKLLAGSLTFSPEISSWPEALAACDGDYVAARKRFPELARNHRINSK